jgi:hypothetical protein
MLCYSCVLEHLPEEGTPAALGLGLMELRNKNGMEISYRTDIEESILRLRSQ